MGWDEEMRGAREDSRFSTGNAPEEVADALIRYSELIANTQDLDGEEVRSFVETHKTLPGFEELASECLRLEQDFRAGDSSRGERHLPTLGSLSLQERVLTKAAPVSRFRWAVAASLLTIGLMASSVAGISLAWVYSNRVASRIKAAENLAVRADSERRKSEQGWLYKQVELEEQSAKAESRAAMEKAEVVKLSGQVKAYQGQEQQWLADRARLEETRKTLADLEQQQAGARRRMEWRNGSVEPQILATFAMDIFGDANNLVLACRAGQQPDVTRQLQDLAKQSQNWSFSRLDDVVDTIGSAGGPGETRLLYVDLKRQITDLTKAIGEQNGAEDKTPSDENADKLASLTLLTYGFKSQLHAIQLRRASAWLSSFRNDSRETDKFLKYVDDLEKLGNAAISAAEQAAPAHARDQIHLLQTQFQQVLDTYRKVSGEPGPPPARATTPSPK